MINLRSDTAAKRSEEMLQFAMAAQSGNMGHQGCPSVERLQAKAARLFGAEAALFTYGGTKSNQIALRLHAPPRSKVFCAATSHIDSFAEAVFAIEPIKIQAIDAKRGAITPDLLNNVLEEQMSRDYAASPSLLVLENTMGYRGGEVYPYETLAQVSELARKNGLKVHVDGARIWHASIVEDRPLSDYMKHADTISVCLAKALGAPQGSVLLGDAATIDRAKIAQRQLGDNMYCVGHLAAAGEFAIDNNRASLAEDHEKAGRFQEILKSSSDITTMHERPPTNMVLFNVSVLRGTRTSNKAEGFTQRLAEQSGVQLYSLPKHWVRVVAHSGVSMEETEQAAHLTAELINAME